MLEKGDDPKNTIPVVAFMSELYYKAYMGSKAEKAAERKQKAREFHAANAGTSRRGLPPNDFRIVVEKTNGGPSRRNRRTTGVSHEGLTLSRNRGRSLAERAKDVKIKPVTGMPLVIDTSILTRSVPSSDGPPLYYCRTVLDWLKNGRASNLATPDTMKETTRILKSPWVGIDELDSLRIIGILKSSMVDVDDISVIPTVQVMLGIDWDDQKFVTALDKARIHDPNSILITRDHHFFELAFRVLDYVKHIIHPRELVEKINTNNNLG